jgi:site-specific DNA-methyltransferase (adenine-specific)
VKPYYEDATTTIYHADCREVVPNLDPKCFVVSDPPYGIAWDTDYKGRGMGKRTQSHTYAPVHEDDEPFDPTFLLRFNRLVLFGANNYSDKLPPSAGWIVWDKTGQGRHVSDLSDAEMAWTNVTGGVRLYSHLWKGMLKDSERSGRRLHPTQKPVALFAWILSKWAKPGDTILDPYLGSGSTLRAAKDQGYKSIGIEIEERYCEIAANRLAQEVLAL